MPSVRVQGADASDFQEAPLPEVHVMPLVVTPSGLTIRRYCPADHDAIWEVHNLALDQVDAHGGNGPWDDDLHDIETVYLANGGEFLVGEWEGRIVSMGALKRLADAPPASAQDSHAEVTRMRVHPDHQRRGHGRAILCALEARAQQLGHTHLHLDTTARQIGAQRLYESHGYRRVGATPWGRFTVLAYEKELA